MRYIMSTVVMALTCLALSAAQAVTLEQRESLRKLQGVEVVIEDINAEASADGLSKDAISTAVELILQSSGIRVLDEPERTKTSSGPFIYINVNAHRDSSTYSLCVGVELRQLVSLVTRPEQGMFVATWSSHALATVGADRLREVIPGLIEPKVKAFANDFLAVNPR